MRGRASLCWAHGVSLLLEPSDFKVEPLHSWDAVAVVGGVKISFFSFTFMDLKAPLRWGVFSSLVIRGNCVIRNEGQRQHLGDGCIWVWKGQTLKEQICR